MGKVIVDIDLFKNVLSDNFSEEVVNEVIDCMNDNNVFIADVAFDVLCNGSSSPEKSCVICRTLSNKEVPCAIAKDNDYDIHSILENCTHARLVLELEK